MSLTTVVAASEAGTVVTFTEAGTFITVTESGTIIRPEQIRLQTIGGALAGPRGLSAYQLAVQEGFNGTLDEWLDTLKGDPATNYITSVFGRVGAITPQAGDYTPAQVGADPAGAAAAAVGAHAGGIDPHGDRAHAQGLVEAQSALDRQYTDGAISALIGGAGPALDTLNELEAALGGDPDFAATMALALGYRLRLDTDAQGLTPTQQQNAWTNLGLGTVVAYNVGDFASSAAFNALSSAYTTHAANTSNPHGVTVAQIGAMPKYGTATTVASASGVVAIDVSATASHYTLTLTENVTTWSFTNLPAAGTYRELHVDIVQHASAAKTVTSPATSGRTAGGAWVASSTLSSREELGLRIYSDGTVELFPSGVMG